MSIPPFNPVILILSVFYFSFLPLLLLLYCIILLLLLILYSNMLHQSIIFLYWSMYILNTRPQLMLHIKVSSYPTPPSPQLPYPLPQPYPNLKLLWDMSDTDKCHLTKPHLSYVSSFQRWIVVPGPRFNISTLTAGDVRVRNFGRPFMISLNHTSSNKGPLVGPVRREGLPRGPVRRTGNAGTQFCWTQTPVQ